MSFFCLPRCLYFNVLRLFGSESLVSWEIWIHCHHQANKGIEKRNYEIFVWVMWWLCFHSKKISYEQNHWHLLFPTGPDKEGFWELHPEFHFTHWGVWLSCVRRVAFSICQNQLLCCLWEDSGKKRNVTGDEKVHFYIELQMQKNIGAHILH